MRGLVSEEIWKDERSRAERVREPPPRPSKFLGVWLCPIPLGHQSFGEYGCVQSRRELWSQLWLGFVSPEERGWAFTGTYGDVNSRHAGSQGTK